MKIGVLQHQHSPFSRPGLLAYVCDAWLEAGHEIEMMRGIPDHAVDVDVLVPHVDLTVTPQDYLEFIDRFPVVVNRRLSDNSKRRISGNLVGPDDAWAGEVIVKTDRNFGGIPEHVIRNTAQGLPLERGVAQRPWKKVDQLLPADYPVFPSIADVPFGVWRNPNLVVEKFLPEKEDGMYCNRVAIVFGDKVLCHRVYSKAKVIKGSRIVRSEEVEPPADLPEVRERFGLDYGKIDFVMHEGEVIVFDINNTPSGLNNPEVDSGIGRKLAPGIRWFQRRAGPGSTG